tara:strand:- start:1963 stop:2115 length:153 start_codon:yes stop_codon:yes gene_type:complete
VQVLSVFRDSRQAYLQEQILFPFKISVVEQPFVRKGLGFSLIVTRWAIAA